ncbi:hypothetical protein COO91_06592 [Nostoc flagelliforme CCNUN1]|uniref:Uncharacterized protein n=1 Tax=Nostoc flagelliforme CCNUN1 TaxID=2038116 RepID=A0A2K8T0N9_9NOSO|nr:hypothetical protein COO91_06592 [Nostoc flagelliforme CCNUN1]
MRSLLNKSPKWSQLVKHSLNPKSKIQNPKLSKSKIQNPK